jgi:hypothetical protein
MRLIAAGQANAAAALFACACREAEQLSLAVDVEHLVLAVAVLGDTLPSRGADAELIRGLIRTRERDALASLGISLDSVRGELEERFGERAWSEPCGLPVSPEAKRILHEAAHRRRTVTPDQLLLALVERSARARRLLFELGVPVGTLREELRC